MAASHENHGHHVHGINASGFVRLHIGNNYHSPFDSKVPAHPDFKGRFSKAPLRPVTNFIERSALHNHIKEQLHDTLTDRKYAPKILVIFGLGGAGKSQLTLNYIRTHQDDYTGVFWIEAGQKESIERDYLQIHNLLFPDCRSSGNEKVAVDIAVTEVKNWFDGRDGRWLFILDSADTIDHEEDDSYINLSVYIPDASSIDAIITTRSSTAKAMSELQAIEVAELETEEAVELLRRCSTLVHTPEKVLIDIVEELGRLALAISLAGAYISKTPRLKNDIHGYIPEYRVRRRNILSQKPKRLVHQYGESVLTTWESSFSAISRESPEASQLLGLLAFVNPDDIFMDLFQMEEKYDWQYGLFPNGVLDKYKLEEAFQTLRTYSLVQRRNDQDIYYMHKLVHAWAHDRLEDEKKDVYSIASLKLLSTISNLSIFGPAERLRFVPHIMVSYNLSVNVYKTSSIRREEVLSWFGNFSRFLNLMGQWSAESQIRDFCFKEKARILGQEHPDTLNSKKKLASTYWNQGWWREAEELDVQVVETRKRVLGQEHPETLAGISNLAMTYWNQGRWNEAEELLVQAAETRKRVLGQEHPDTLTNMNNLASTYRNQGRWKEAEEFGVQVMETSTRVLGQEHPGTLNSISNLASTYRNQGRWKEAYELQVQVVETRKKVSGQEHPDTLNSISNLALIYWNQGRWKEAEELQVQVMETSTRVLGQEHPDTMTSISNLASTYSNQGQWKEAEALGIQVIEKRKRVLGQDHPATLMSISNLASMYSDQGRWKEAEELEVQLIEKRKRMLGHEHPDTLTSMSNLAHTWKSQGRDSVAIELMTKAVQLSTEKLGASHPETRFRTNRLKEWTKI